MLTYIHVYHPPAFKHLWRTTLNMLEFIASTIGPWIDLIEVNLPLLAVFFQGLTTIHLPAGSGSQISRRITENNILTMID